MSTFFAFINRLKYINRWSLMRNVREENVMEHSAMVSLIAYSLAIIANKRSGKDLNAEKIGMMALLHETSEVLTGDLPTPIKYHNEVLTKAYKQIEQDAVNNIVSTLPDELSDEFDSLLNASSQEEKYIKYADKIAAYLKCVEELSQGNNEFAEAKMSIKTTLDGYNNDDVNYFIDNFAESFVLSLDKLMLSIN